MPEEPCSVDTRRDGGEAVVRVRGDLDLAAVPLLAGEVEGLVDSGGTSRLVVDLAGVDFVDSSGLTSLIHARRAAEEAGMGFALRAPTERVRRTLELTRLTSVFEVE